jgi:hydrogenase-4 component E
VTAGADVLLLLVLVTDLYIVSSGRLAACVRALGVQGVLLAALPLTLWGPRGSEAHLVHLVAMSAGALAVKAVVIPALLLRSAREAGARREVEPYVSLHLSVLLGALLVMLSLWLAHGLVPPERGLAPLLMPAGFATLLLGFLMLVARKYAVTQVVGYLMLDNGVFIFGQTLAGAVPVVVELGILLDLLVAVFVMGIAIHHIGREFDHIDTRVLTTLRD